MKLDDTSPLFKQMAASRVFLHLSCFPTEGIDEYYEQEYGDDPSILKAQERNESNINPTLTLIEFGGPYSYDIFAERDRWQLYSKQL